MVCSGLDALTDNSIVGILSFPTSCDFYFYSKLMTAFFIILSFILYNREDDEKNRKADMLSAMGVSAIATIIISAIGTFAGIIERTILIQIFVVGIIIICIWVLRR